MTDEIAPIKKAPILSAIAAVKGQGQGITIAPQQSDAEVMLKMMDKILSNDNMEQKSRLIFENIRAMCQSVVFTQCMRDGTVFLELPPIPGIRFVDPRELWKLDEFKDYPEFKNHDAWETIISDLKALSDEMLKRIVSVDGMGRNEIIQLAHAFSFQIQQHQHEQSLADKVIGLRK